MPDRIIEKYLSPDVIYENVEKVKKELTFLRKSEKMGKITDAGRKRKEKLEDYLFSKNIFDF